MEEKSSKEVLYRFSSKGTVSHLVLPERNRAMNSARFFALLAVLGGYGALEAMGQEWEPWPGPQPIRQARAVHAIYDEAEEPQTWSEATPQSGQFGSQVEIFPANRSAEGVRFSPADEGLWSGPGPGVGDEERPVDLPPVPIARATPPEAPLHADPPPAAKPQAEEEFFTLDELKAEMKKLAWSKGDFKIVPYGHLWGDLIYNSARTNPGPYTLFVNSFATDGEHEFIADARRTRLGFDVSGPTIPWFGGAASGGKVEIDFFGDGPVNPNRAGVLLRHAYFELKNEDFRFLFGQTSDVISPIFPGVLMYSVGWDGGNIGYRRTQLRLERYFNFSDVFRMEFQGSLNQDIVADFTSVSTIDREAADWPLVEGRIGWVIGPRGQGSHPITMGVSAHIGEMEYDFKSAGPAPLNLPPADDERFRTWSLNADFRAPITERLGVQGEFFMGENLSSFLGGIAQGVCLYNRHTIRSYGGWIDLWYDWTDRLHTHVGWGLDDPLNEDFLVGRTYNQFIFINFSYDITKNFVTGIEVSSWKTLYQDRREGQVPDSQLGPRRPGEATIVEWMLKYSF